MLNKFILCFTALFSFLSPGLALSATPIDLKIAGSGLFILEAKNGQRLYSKSLRVSTDADGFLVSRRGRLNLMAYTIDSEGVPSSVLSKINLSNISLPPAATQKIVYALNLDASSPIKWFPFDATSRKDSERTASFSVSSTIYESLGNPIQITTYFVKRAPGVWGYFVLAQSSALSPEFYIGDPEGMFIVCKGELYFSEDGRLSSAVPSEDDTEDSFGRITAGGIFSTKRGHGIPWANGAMRLEDLAIEFSPDGVTSYATNYSSIDSIQIDGQSSGILNGIDFDGGTIFGNFSNGARRSLFEIPLAQFMGEDFLWRLESGFYLESPDSGAAQIRQSNTGGAGSILVKLN